MRVRVNEYQLLSPKISRMQDLLMISDIHSNINALKTIKSLLTGSTKCILIPGDLLDHVQSEEKEAILEELRVLSEYVPVILSLGNHDTVRFEKQGFQKKEIPTDDYSFFHQVDEETNCIVLSDFYSSFPIDSEMIVHAVNMPVTWYQEGENLEELTKGLSSIPYQMNEDQFHILLSHSPNGIIINNRINRYINIVKDSNLILSGHNHGGLTPIFIQDKCKSNKGIVGPYCKIIQPNAYGIWTSSDTSLILSNGITKIATSSELSLLSSMINKMFIPDVELIHLTPTLYYQELSLQNRKVYRIK